MKEEIKRQKGRIKGSTKEERKNKNRSNRQADR
jgi:hypothetical protein